MPSLRRPDTFWKKTTSLVAKGRPGILSKSGSGLAWTLESEKKPGAVARMGDVKPRLVTCRGCGAVFTAHGNRAKWCDLNCRQRTVRRLAREARPRPPRPVARRKPPKPKRPAAPTPAPAPAPVAAKPTGVVVESETSARARPPRPRIERGLDGRPGSQRRKTPMSNTPCARCGEPVPAKALEEKPAYCSRLCAISDRPEAVALCTAAFAEGR